MTRDDVFDSPLDPGIRDAVEILRAAGVETFESCQGGTGHAYPEPTVRFCGPHSDGFKALAVALQSNLPVLALRRVWPIDRARRDDAATAAAGCVGNVRQGISPRCGGTSGGYAARSVYTCARMPRRLLPPNRNRGGRRARGRIGGAGGLRGNGAGPRTPENLSATD
jgi:hypothetical protein